MYLMEGVIGSPTVTMLLSIISFLIISGMGMFGWYWKTKISKEETDKLNQNEINKGINSTIESVKDGISSKIDEIKDKQNETAKNAEVAHVKLGENIKSLEKTVEKTENKVGQLFKKSSEHGAELKAIKAILGDRK